MKPTKKKLTLQIETLRSLRTDDLGRVAGGAGRVERPRKTELIGCPSWNARCPSDQRDCPSDIDTHCRECGSIN
jgi:hypothetical protein